MTAIFHRHFIARFALAAGLSSGVVGAVQAEPRIYQDSGFAIDGYDAVAYHTLGKPTNGKSAYTFQWEGATWRFASAENRDLFIANPTQYAPQYNGYCAWAARSGYFASTTPDAWEIVDGKLYLNYNRSVHKNWARDIPGNIAKADANWPEMQRELDQ